jgi:ATP-dependent RNA helicase DDX51/DBP6
LFSATLTRDPAAIASLNLRNPQYYIVQESTFLDTTTLGESFALPSTLSEKYLALPPQLKPLNLIHLLHSPEFAVKGGLVFTKSVESVNRLVSLLSYFEEEYRPGEKVVVKGYTSEMRPVERKNLLSGFAKGEIHLSVDISDLLLMREY